MTVERTSRKEKITPFTFLCGKALTTKLDPPIHTQMLSSSKTPQPLQLLLQTRHKYQNLSFLLRRRHTTNRRVKMPVDPRLSEPTVRSHGIKARRPQTSHRSSESSRTTLEFEFLWSPVEGWRTLKREEHKGPLPLPESRLSLKPEFVLSAA